MPLELDAAYTCPACFQENWLGVDPTAGSKQRLIEDCPVCCRPIAFTIHIDHEGDPLVISAELAN